MDKGPERLRPADNPETTRLSSVFPFARHLRSFASMERASMWFLGLGVADGLQVAINRFILNPDPLRGTVEGISDLGMVLAADNLRSSPLKWLAMAEGFMGLAGSALIKTGNPDLFYPALILASTSGFLGMMHLASGSGSEPSSRSVPNGSTEEILPYDPWGKLVDAISEECGKPK